MTESEQENFYIQLGISIKKYREEAGLKQEAFAQMLKLSRASIVNIEKGRQRTPIHMMWDISKVLKIDVNQLFASLIIENKDKIEADWKKRITESTKGDPKSRKKITDFIIEINLNEADNESKKN